MKIAQMSDLHYSPENLIEADRCFGYAVEAAILQKVQVAIIAGDSTDHKLDAHSPALFALARRIKQLADHCPVLLLQGTFSHEPVGTIQILQLIGAKHPIIVADRIGQIGLTKDHQWVELSGLQSTHEMALVVTCVPTVNKAELLQSLPVEHVNVEMGNQLAAVLESFSGVNAAWRSKGVPTVLVSHGTVDGSLNETGVPMAGLDHEFTQGSLFAAGCSATMIGHIHKHQSWKREHRGVAQAIAYAGSIGRFHYGEIGEKHFLIWSVDAACATFSALVTPSRKMIDLTFDGIPDLDEISKIAEQCHGAFVRVIYSVDEEFSQGVDRTAIKKLLAGAAEVKIDGTILAIQRQRAPGISQLRTLHERFAMYCDVSNIDKNGLLERLYQLQTEEPEAIAARIAGIVPTTV